MFVSRIEIHAPALSTTAAIRIQPGRRPNQMSDATNSAKDDNARDSLSITRSQIAIGVVTANVSTAQRATRRGQPAWAHDATTHASSAHATIESATWKTITASWSPSSFSSSGKPGGLRPAQKRALSSDFEACTSYERVSDQDTGPPTASQHRSAANTTSATTACRCDPAGPRGLPVLLACSRRPTLCDRVSARAGSVPAAA